MEGFYMWLPVICMLKCNMKADSNMKCHAELQNAIFICQGALWYCIPKAAGGDNKKF